MIVLCHAIVALLAFQLPPPPSQPCYTFSDTPLACGGCADVNNCGNCYSGACNAFHAQECSKGKIGVLTQGSGFTKVRLPVNCFYKVPCVPPDPCEGACGVDDDAPFGYSEDTNLIDWPDVACGSST